MWINVYYELAVDDGIPEWHGEVLMVGEVQAVQQSVRVMAVNLCAYFNDIMLSVSKGVVRTMKTTCSFVCKSVCTSNRTRMPSDFSQTQ